MSDLYIERKIIIAMIVSTEYLDKIFQIAKSEFFESIESRMMAKWILQYYSAYRRAPQKEMELLYESKAKRIDDKDQKEFIEGILDSLSREYQQEAELMNVDYLVDKTEEYFRIRSCYLLADDLKTATANYDSKACMEALNAHQKIEASHSNTTDPLKDSDAITAAFSRQEERLMSFPGAFGNHINEYLVSTGFVGIMGAEKMGKSWMLGLFAEMGIRNGRNVAMFHAGDMDEQDHIIRMHVGISGRSNEEKYCGDIYVPVLDCKKNQTGECQLKHRQNEFALRTCVRKKRSDTEEQSEVITDPEQLVKLNPEYEPCSYCYEKNVYKFKGAPFWKLRSKCSPLTAQEAVMQGKKFSKLWKGQMKISAHPNNTLTVSMIESIMDEWERVDNFIPKIIVVDYADILRPANTKLDFRHQQNEIWKDGRSLCKKRNCLLVWATQANSASYNSELLSLSNFSEDKRKYGHVTAMIGLNQTSVEKEMGIMRINTLVARGGHFNNQKSVTMLQCLQMGRPLISSYYG